jgi:hypothetical protein
MRQPILARNTKKCTERRGRMMEAQTPSRRDLETALIEKCWKDPEFKREVVKDPKGMLERHTGQKLPAQVKIFVHEEDPYTLHLTLPPTPANITELSDEDLEKVAGGTDVFAIASFVATVVGSAAATVGTALKGSNLW